MQIVDGYLKRRAEYSLYNLFNIYIYTYVDIIHNIYLEMYALTFVCERNLNAKICTLKQRKQGF